MKNLTLAAAFVFAGLTAGSVFAADGAAEKTGEAIHEGAHDTAKHAKKAGRAVKHGACKMVHGKQECAGMAAKNAALNASDEVSDKADDIKKKVD